MTRKAQASGGVTLSLISSMLVDSCVCVRHQRLRLPGQGQGQGDA